MKVKKEIQMTKTKKYVKLGVIMKGEKGPYLILGNNKNKNADFNYSVEVRVVDNSGNKKAYTKNGILSLFNPRKRPGITEEQASRIPKSLEYDVMLVVDEE